VVSFTPLPLYPWGKSSRYPMDRRLGGPQNQSGRCGEEKILDPSRSIIIIIIVIITYYSTSPCYRRRVF
jgi:hypothetical protein